MSRNQDHKASVSIIMPFRDAGPYIEESVLSIMRQRHLDWELLAVNDHSEDFGAEVVRKFAAYDQRIQLLKNKGQGIIPALQTGLEASSGMFITRMDADDRMPPERLLKMAKALESSPNKTVISGLVKYISEREVSPGYQNYERWLNEVQKEKTHWQNIYRECVVASPNWMMRKSELLRLGGFSALHYPEDYDLVFKWYQQGYTIEPLPEVTLLWREHTQRTSRHSEHYQQKAFFKMKLRYFMQLELGNKQLILWGTGKKGRLSAEILKTLQVPFRWMDFKPHNKGTEIMGIPIEPFQNTLLVENKKILISVYPPHKERLAINDFLEKAKLKEGVDFWYL